jgi:hypothetical protein
MEQIEIDLILGQLDRSDPISANDCSRNGQQLVAACMVDHLDILQSEIVEMVDGNQGPLQNDNFFPLEGPEKLQEDHRLPPIGLTF